jgi:hypothetical protein
MLRGRVLGARPAGKIQTRRHTRKGKDKTTFANTRQHKTCHKEREVIRQVLVVGKEVRA